MKRVIERYSGRIRADAEPDIYVEYKRDRPKWFDLMEAGKEQEAAEFRARTILK